MNANNTNKSFVYDKKSNILVECEFGNHFKGIQKILKQVFGSRYAREVDQNVIDDYVMNNIVLEGQNCDKEWYRELVRSICFKR